MTASDTQATSEGTTQQIPADPSPDVDGASGVPEQAPVVPPPPPTLDDLEPDAEPVPSDSISAPPDTPDPDALGRMPPESEEPPTLRLRALRQPPPPPPLRPPPSAGLAPAAGLPLPPEAEAARLAPRSSTSTSAPFPRLVALGPVLEQLQACAASPGAVPDRVARGRLLGEIALVHLLTGDRTQAQASARAALAETPDLPAMHALLRAELPSRPPTAAHLEHLDAEIGQCPPGPQLVSLLADRARLLGALGRHEDALTTWSRVLAFEPHHAAALQGKEASLCLVVETDARAWKALASHLGAMAEAYADDAPLTAACIQVERAAILEWRLSDVTSARQALVGALALDSKVGPVRAALLRHLARHRDTRTIVDLLDDEATIEGDPARAARLELEAAVIAEWGTCDARRAIGLLERAAARQATPALSRRVLDDLVRLLETAGRTAEAVPWRRARLALLEASGDRAEELRAIALDAEQTGDVDGAIECLGASLEEEPDAKALDRLDQLLARRGNHPTRVELWARHAAISADAPTRTDRLLRAALIAERELGDLPEATAHLRAAWTTEPGRPDVLEALTRLLARPTHDAEARARVELFTHAAEVARDGAHKTTYLERVALLAEESLNDPARAAAAYDQMLAIEPDRLGTILGLGRTAARAGDDRGQFRALMAEARVCADDALGRELRTRAAAVIARVDPALGLATANDVLAADPSHDAARSLVTRLHEEAERWELVARSVEDHLTHAPSGRRRDLLLYLATVQADRLKASSEALTTLRHAAELFPTDARVVAFTARTLATLSDPHALCDAYRRLADTSTSDQERAAFLLRVGEITEHALGDDAEAVRTYQEALDSAPGDAMIAERLARVRCRSQGHVAEAPLDRALEAIVRGTATPDSTALLLPLLDDPTCAIGALHLLARLHRRAGAWDSLADDLRRQSAALTARGPRLGALWALVDLEDYRLGCQPDAGSYTQVLALTPDDLSALRLAVRDNLPRALAGEDAPRRAAVDALTRMVASQTGGVKAATSLLLAHLLEWPGTASDSSTAEAAIALYRGVLGFDRESITAAAGLRRVAHRLDRKADAARASAHLAGLTVDPKTRARHLFEAAEAMLTGADDPSRGERTGIQGEAAAFLERALAAYPDWTPPADLLIQIRGERGEHQALVDALWTALGASKSRDAAIFHGTEIARVARDHLRDIPMATRAMSRVREVAPDHAPGLLTFAELLVAQRAWPEAVSMLESVVAAADDDETRLTALVALASVYDKILARPADYERVLRHILTVQADHAQALRSLASHLRAVRDGAGPASGLAAGPRAALTREIVALLQRLGRAEADPTRQAAAFFEAAEQAASLGDVETAERSLHDGMLCDPSGGGGLARLKALMARDPQQAAVTYARSLSELVTRGRARGRLGARWLVALGRVEMEVLQRLPAAVDHLAAAVQADPSSHEARLWLARAHAMSGAEKVATEELVSLLGLDPCPLPAMPEVGVALALTEHLLEQDHRPEEATVVTELRGILGDGDPRRMEELRARRLARFERHHVPLRWTALVDLVLPRPARHVLVEVAHAAAGLESTMPHPHLADLGVSERERVGPRSGHPLRPAFDRARMALGVDEVDLVVTAAVDRPRVVAQGTPCVVVPASLVNLPEGVQVAVFARACARVLLGVPWLLEVDARSVVDWLTAVAAHAGPDDAAAGALAAGAAGHRQAIARAIGRRQRKLLERLVPRLTGTPAAPPEPLAFVRGLDQCTARAAYLVAGDLAATIRAINADDRALHDALSAAGPAALASLLAHPVAGDVARFALTREATALRQPLGAVWLR